jgi:ribosomal-protein-alanine N-acetyltransferase
VAPVTISRLRWWQIDDLLPLEVDLFGPERWTAAMFWNELASGQQYVVATLGEEIVGYAGLALAPPDEAWINNIAVSRAHQRQGIGQQLLDDLLVTAREAGARQILLEVAADNGPAQRLYDRNGFEIIGVRRGYYQTTKTDALVMRLTLPDRPPYAKVEFSAERRAGQP